MRSRVFQFIKLALLVWGAFSLVAFIAYGIYVGYCFGIAQHEKNDSASPDDVRYVLDACHLNDKRIEQVLHSHISSRGLGWDHLDAFAFKLSDIQEADFTGKPNTPNEHWFRGDQLPPVLEAALKLVDEWHDGLPWFPTGAELKSSDVYVFPMDFYCCCGSVEPTMARLVFVRKTDKTAFYFDFKP